MRAQGPTLCCAAWGFRAFELPVYFAAAARIGFRHVEVGVTRVEHSLSDLGPSPSRAEIDACLSAAEEAGVQIAVLAGTNDFTFDDPARHRAEIEFARRQVDTAAALGVRLLRLFAGLKPFKELTSESYARTGAAIREVGEYAAGRGVSVAIENHGGMTRTAAQLRRLLDAAPLPNVGYNFDPANFAGRDEDPLAAYHILRERIIYLHLKDVRWKEDGVEYCPIGEGMIDWGGLLPALRETYRGYWSVEYEEATDIMEGTRRSVAALARFGVTF